AAAATAGCDGGAGMGASGPSLTTACSDIRGPGIGSDVGCGAGIVVTAGGGSRTETAAALASFAALAEVNSRAARSEGACRTGLGGAATGGGTTGGVIAGAFCTFCPFCTIGATFLEFA